MEARGNSASSSSFSFTPEQVSERRPIISVVRNSFKTLCQWSERGRSLTERHQDFVQHVVQGPDVGGPVGVTEAPLKGEEPGQELRELTLKQTCLTILTHSCTLQAQLCVCVLFFQLLVSHHGDERAEGQSTDGGHNAGESQQAERTETPPADRTVCTEPNTPSPTEPLPACRVLQGPQHGPES